MTGASDYTLDFTAGRSFVLNKICCDTLGDVSSNLKMVKFFMQHLWMLHDAVVVWPGSSNNVAPGYAH